jgi:malonyl-CoA O-methyltransferase
MSTPLQRTIGKRFDAAAATYDKHAAIQWAVARRLLWEVEKGPAPRRILEIGCGTGLLTEQLRERFPAAAVHALDISSAMITVARQRWRGAARVRWHVADVRRYRPAGRFDLIVSNCALHWVEPLAPVFRRIARWLTPGGHFHAALMLRGTLAELHAARRRVAPRKPTVHALPSFATVSAAARRAGFATLLARRHQTQKSYSSASALLTMLHEQGLTGGPVAGSGRPLTRSELGRLVADYERNYPARRGGIQTTFRVAYLCARKG